MADAIDEFTLLCESCGYVLAGLPTEGNCPECGRPIAESAPAQRPGSAWQRKRGLRAWARTNLESMFAPRAYFRLIRMESKWSLLLLAVNLVAAGLAAFLPAPILDSFRRSPDAGMWTSAWFFGFVCPNLADSIPPAIWKGVAAAPVVLLALTFLEYLGVRLFWHRSRWRVTNAVAWTVCCHASVGWLLGGIIVGTLIIIEQWIETWEFSRIFPYLYFIPWIGMFGGLLAFETLVYIGIRRCRFANRMPPDAPAA